MKNADLNNIIKDFKSGIMHGVLVANITYALAKRLGMSEDEAYQLKIAGMVHDIGKLKLCEYLYGRNEHGLSVEEMKYMRLHSKIGYDVLKKYNYSDNILEVVLRHHECYDGSGYPDNLKADNIPYGARVLRVADEFAALISKRPYRKAFSPEEAIHIMIDEIKNMDMKIFLEFQRMVNEDDFEDFVKKSSLDLDSLSDEKAVEILNALGFDAEIKD